MVKIPSMDGLKKMGSDLMDTAKAVKIGGVVDKIKTGMESVGKKPSDAATNAQADTTGLQASFEAIEVSLAELLQAQTLQINTTKKLQDQVAALKKAAEEAAQKPATLPDAPA